MRNLWFALKRWLHQPGFVLLLLLGAAAVFLTSLPWAAGQVPPAGVCDLEGSGQSRRIVAFLLDNGYEEYDDAAQMEAMVARGELDCCVVLPETLSAQIVAGELEGALRFVSSPTSFTPGLYRNLAAAALFREHAPYVTAQALAETEIDREQVLERYFSMFETGPAFSFEIRNASGGVISTPSGPGPLFLCAVSLLLLALLVSGAGELTSRTVCDIRGRIGLAPWLRKVLLPGLFARALLAAAAVTAAILAAAANGCTWALSLIVPALIDCLLLSALAMFLIAILPRTEYISVLLPVLIIATLAFCPVFVDLSLFSPVLAAVRLFVPGYWLWLIAEKPVQWLVIAVLGLAGSTALLALRCCFMEKFRLTNASLG